jgi:hypothetical protein
MRDRRPVDPARQRQQQRAGEKPAPDADQRKKRRLDGKRQRRRDEPRGDEIGVRAGAHGLERGDLLAVALDAQLGREGGPGLADQHQGGEHRAELAHEGQGNQLAERAVGAIPAQHIIALEAEHQAREQADDHDDRQAAHALLIQGADDTPAQLARAHRRAQRLPGKKGEITKLAHHGERNTAKELQHGFAANVQNPAAGASAGLRQFKL